MNYMNQLNVFWRIEQMLNLTPSASYLYLRMLSIYNGLHWAKSITPAENVVKGTLKHGAFIKARKLLIDKGLIEYKSRGANRSAKYEIFELTDKRVQSLFDHSGDHTGDCTSDHSSDHTGDPYIRRDETNKDKRRKHKKRVYDQDSDFMKLAEFLQKQILLNKPDFKKPNLQSWADGMRKIVELDHRDKHQVALVIKWAQHDSFWSINVMSPDKLRKQYDRLTLQMQSSQGSTSEPRVSKQEDAKKKVEKERSKFVLYKYSEAGNDLEKALPIIKDKYPEIDTPDKALRILFPERYLTAGGVEVGN